ncbi:MAG: hypothetical protein IPG84_12855 [Betaproteobacteria bacterium]|nr:hypothetical protein [Betaproteobacteria bacterium]
MTLPTIRRALGIAGTVLLGGALALAPIAAFGGDMRIVSGTGIAGIALLIVMRLLPRPPEPDDDARPATGDDVPPPP